MNRKFGKRGAVGTFGGCGQNRRSPSKKGYLPEELMSHYRRVQESLRQFENEENVAELDHSKGEFLNNVVSGLAEELVQVSQNQTVSTIVESIIASASSANHRILFVAAVTDLAVIFLDRFASHVFEALILRLPEFFEQQTHTSPDEEDDDVSQDKVVESLGTVCEFVDAQFETLVTHMYGSHVLRAFLEALSGVSVVHELKKSRKSGHSQHNSKKGVPKQTQKPKSPQKFKVLFNTYAKRLFCVCDYEVHLKDPYFSLMLQAVLMILQKTDPDLCQRHCQTILQQVVSSCPQCDDPSASVPDTAQDTAGSHLLEVVFKLSDGDVLCQIYDSLLKGKLLYYAIHPVANHVLQTYLSFVQDRDLMANLFEELSKYMEDVMAMGYFGLVTSLAEGCRRLRVKQDEFIMTLMETFHCKEPEERQKSLIKLIASLTAYEAYFSVEEGKETPTEGTEEPSLTGPVNMHGSLMIQELLQFQKPKHAALGLLELKPAELQLLCCDPAGSHIVDVFFSSPSVLGKNRDIFLRKLKELTVEIACTKNGSRCLESVWQNLTVQQRLGLAKELADSERLPGDRFGHFLHKNLQLALFKSTRKRWLKQQGEQTKRKRMLKELLNKTEPPVKKIKSESPDANTQKEDPIDDSVTALFIKHRRKQDAGGLASADPREFLASEGVTPRGKKKKIKVEEGGEGTAGDSSSSSDFVEAGNPPHDETKKKKKVKVGHHDGNQDFCPSSSDFTEAGNALEGKIKKKKKVKACGDDGNQDSFPMSSDSMEAGNTSHGKTKKKKKVKACGDDGNQDSFLMSSDSMEAGNTSHGKTKKKKKGKAGGDDGNQDSFPMSSDSMEAGNTSHGKTKKKKRKKTE